MSGLQVLVACSHVQKRSALVAILVECGLKATTAANFREVRAVLTQNQVHLVFCEDDLPGGGFRGVLRLTKAIGSGAPVVVCSLLSDLDEYLEAMGLGAFDFIAPPYRGAEVESIVNSVRQTYLSRAMGGNRLHTPAGAVSRDDGAVA